MNYTELPLKSERLTRTFRKAKNEIESLAELKLPVTNKNNPEKIDFSNKLSVSNGVYHNKIEFEILHTPLIHIEIEVSKTPKVSVSIGEKFVKNGFFVKDLYLSLLGEDRFTYDNFLKTLSPAESIFISCGVSFLKGGIIVHLPEKTTDVELRIRKNFKENISGSFYTMLYIPRDTSVKICEEVYSDGKEKGFSFELVELIAETNSKVWYNILQKLDRKSEYLITRKISTYGNNNIEFNNVLLGAEYHRGEDRISIEGRNVELKYTGIYFVNDSQRYDILVNTRHCESEQGADVIVKGVLDDFAKVYFNGVLKVDEKLGKINSFLGGHALHLSANCKSESIPSLEIDSFDVKAGHSASVTQLDNEKLFYIMSRGLSEDEAKKVIVQGFIDGAIGRISDEEFRKKIEHGLREKGLKILEAVSEI
ncbi:MAG: SufD family Fe-S cluster assembly protein [Brevinematia bacterium]